MNLERRLLIEQGGEGHRGPALPACDVPVQPIAERLPGVKLRPSLDLPQVSEPEVVRHFIELSTLNHHIDKGLYPLGSCTMKHNPRLNEKLARLPGFGDIHPLQPIATVQGALALMAELTHWLVELTGMPVVALSPKAGAQGELCGLLAIRAALAARGETRRHILVPESAHGTNPASAAIAGFEVEEVKATEDGRVHVGALTSRLKPDIAGIMLTNPNTCGLFERDIVEIAHAVHRAGAYFLESK